MNAMAEEPAVGSAFRLAEPLPGDGLGVAPGLIAGKRPEALPAPMSELEMLLRFGTGPSGSVVPGAAGGVSDGDEPAGAVAAAGDGDGRGRRRRRPLGRGGRRWR